MTNLRATVRSLRKNPAFTGAAIVTLALGIGATTAMFGVVNAVLLRPLPFPHPDRLVTFSQTNAPAGVDRNVTSFPNLDDWRESPQLAELGGYYRVGVALTGSQEPEQLDGAVVTAGFFDTLGIAPALGGPFAADASTGGNERVAMLSHVLWQRRFGADPGIVGRSVTLNAATYSIAGVMPAGFRFPHDVEVWLPLSPAGTFNRLLRERGAFWLSAIGRLRPGATQAALQSELDLIARRLSTAHPQTNRDLGVAVLAMHEHLVAQSRPALLMLICVVLGVLLIACANVANLMLARSAERERDVAVRTALGAGRRQAVNQLLGESVVLSTAGGVAGVALAACSLRLLATTAPRGLPRLDEVGLDVSVLVFAALLTIGTALVFGLAPALHSSRLGVGESLKHSAKGIKDHSRGRQLRNALVVLEMALAALLLVGAGLLVRSFTHLLAVDPGFRPERLLTFRVTLPRLKYAQPAQAQDFFDRVVERLQGLPGVESVSASGSLMFARLPQSSSLSVAGRPAPPAGAVHEPVMYDSVTPGFFRTLGIKLRRGRVFTATDDGRARRVALINETFARRIFGAGEAIGQRVTLENPDRADARWYEIVGVVNDAHRAALDKGPAAELYVPHAQQPTRAMVVAVRTTGEPTALARAAAAQVWALDPDLPVSRVETMEALMAEATLGRRVLMNVAAGFAGLALVLAAVGVYGVLAYATSQRVQEIGIRVALGAQRGDVLRLVLRHGLGLAAGGLALGLATALPLSNLMSGLLFGIRPLDPLTFATIALVLMSAAALATYLPARRATRVDPQGALRTE